MTGGVKDCMYYYGNYDTFIFQITPKLRFLYSYNGNGENNYIYMNTKKIQNSIYKVGLGFGGKDYKNHRIWIDDEMCTESETKMQQDTYDFGGLTEGFAEKLQIVNIEAWGLGGDEAIKKRKEYREMVNKMRANAGKVDLKAFYNDSFTKEVVLEKTFAHRAQVRDGVLDEVDEHFAEQDRKKDEETLKERGIIN